MGRVTKTFHYPKDSLATMQSDIVQFITNNSNLTYTDGRFYHPSIVGVSLSFSLWIDVTSQSLYWTGGSTNLEACQTASNQTDVARTCQVTIYSYQEDIIVVFGSYNNLDGIASWFGALSSIGMFYPSITNAIYNESGNAGSVSSLVSDVATPLGQIYLGDAYFGTANAFNDLVVPGLKGYASDKTLQAGKRYTAGGKKYLCLNASARLLWEY